MSSILLAVILLETEKHSMEKIKRKTLRDHSNPLEMSNTAFIAQYRLNKEAFISIITEVESYVQHSSIPTILQLATTLRFLAEGGYQRSVGKDANVALGRSTVSKVITNMLNHLERRICPKWIQLNISEEDQRKLKRQFYEKFGIPGIIGCIDGTHVSVIQPHEDGSLYYNRKGYYSINAMIICDFNLMIQAIDACHPGSSHDSFIWNLSNARRYFLSKYQTGERRSWLLGDGGYGIEPFLLTPYRNPEPGSIQHKFNLTHASACNVVERTIGVLKSRFRCLLGTLQYNPQKVAKIINVCCALHNICRHYNIQHDFDEETTLELNGPESENHTSSNNTSLQNEGEQFRDEIANSL